MADQTCAKCITCFCNLLFGLSGLLIFVVGAMLQFNYTHYKNFVSDDVMTAPILLMIVGGLVSFICFLGCCGSIHGNMCMILAFAILALPMFFTEIGLGIVAYDKHNDIQPLMQIQFNNSMKTYNDREDYRDAWTLLQTELRCCGTYGPSDWENVFKNNKTIPPSCCTVINLNQAENCTMADANSAGCLSKLLEIVNSNAFLLTSIIFGLAGIQLLTILCACVLFRCHK